MGLGVNAMRIDVSPDGHPRRLPLVAPAEQPPQASEVIPLREAEAAWRAGSVFFLDARSPADFAVGHVALAHNLPSEEFAQYYPQVSAMLTKDAALVVYCDGVQCELSRQLAVQLRSLGYTNVRLLINGWTVWRKAGLPTDPPSRP